MEAALSSVVEAISWLDWWTYAMKSFSLKSIDDTSLPLAVVKCQLIAITALTLWASVVLKRRVAVLAKVKDYIL